MPITLINVVLLMTITIIGIDAACDEVVYKSGETSEVCINCVSRNNGFFRRCYWNQKAKKCDTQLIKSEDWTENVMDCSNFDLDKQIESSLINILEIQNVIGPMFDYRFYPVALDSFLKTTQYKAFANRIKDDICMSNELVITEFIKVQNQISMKMNSDDIYKNVNKNAKSVLKICLGVLKALPFLGTISDALGVVKDIIEIVDSTMKDTTHLFDAMDSLDTLIDIEMADEVKSKLILHRFHSSIGKMANSMRSVAQFCQISNGKFTYYDMKDTTNIGENVVIKQYQTLINAMLDRTHKARSKQGQSWKPTIKKLDADNLDDLDAFYMAMIKKCNNINLIGKLGPGSVAKALRVCAKSM
jgi:hypothetical protein